MSPRTEKQFEEIRKSKRELIMDAALEEFAKHGYHASSINKITKRAGISKGLLYNYFESKEALLKEIIKKAHDEVWVYFDPNHDGELTNEEFYYFIKQNFRVVKDNVSFWKLLSATLLQPNVSQIIENDFDEKTIQYSAMLFDFFKRNKCENPEEETMIFSALIKGVTIMFVGNPELLPLDKYESAILSFYKKKFK